jgi:hypothetical protein
MRATTRVTKQGERTVADLLVDAGPPRIRKESSHTRLRCCWWKSAPGDEGARRRLFYVVPLKLGWGHESAGQRSSNNFFPLSNPLPATPPTSSPDLSVRRRWHALALTRCPPDAHDR